MFNTKSKTRSESLCESKAASEAMGLHLCEACLKSNEERLKVLFWRSENDYMNEIKEVNKNLQIDFKEQNQQLLDLKGKIELIEKLLLDQAEQKQEIQLKLHENKQEAKKWSELFSSKVETLVSDVKTVQKNVSYVNERSLRKNNIVIYNVPENESNSRLKDRDFVLNMMKEISGKDMKDNINELFRMGKRTEEATNPRPLLIKFNSFIDKNLIMENCSKLRRNEAYKSIMINHDLSKEDREEIRKLISEKKKEIALKEDINKWGLRVKGQPGEFYIVSYRRQNL